MERALLKIKRQDDPEDLPYWELFEIELDEGSTVSQALRAISMNPVTAEGNPTTPVAWDCSCNEGVCGSCTVLVNGKARLACKVSVGEFDGPIKLEPLSKFPIVRDLKVDRNPMLEALRSHECWVALDDLEPAGVVPLADPEAEERISRYMDCVLCGSCSEACPQVNARSSFGGAFVFANVIRLNAHPIGAFGASARFTALGGRGGVGDCGRSENCEAVCPMGIPLAEAAAKLGWSTTWHSVKSFLWG